VAPFSLLPDDDPPPLDPNSNNTLTNEEDDRDMDEDLLSQGEDPSADQGKRVLFLSLSLSSFPAIVSS
jgi:hypothetical protein